MNRLFNDRFSIDSQREVTREGYLLAKNSKLARTGILRYKQEELGDLDGMPENRRGTTIRVHRAADPLLTDSVMESFKAKPVTVFHPSDMVSADTIKDEMVGMIRDNIRAEDKYMVGDLLIMDKDAIQLINDGTQELSLGYTADIIWEEGISDEGEYDAVMKNYSGNHVAIVPKGRCGSECKVADSDSTKTTGKDKMKKIVIDGKDYEVDEAVSKHITDMEAEKKEAVEDAEEKTKALEAKKAELEGRLDAVNSDMEEMKKKQIGDADISAMVSARVELEGKSRKIIGDSMDFKDMSDRALKVASVKARNGMEIADEKHDEYVNALFDHVCAETSTESTEKNMNDAAPVLPLSERKLAEKKQQNQDKWSNK